MLSRLFLLYSFLQGLSFIEGFTLKIDPQKFRSSNAAWNQLRLNDPWSVGYVSRLIESQQFDSKQAWEHFYLQSGADRLLRLLNCSKESRQLLLDDSIGRIKPQLINCMPYEQRQINHNFGRSASCLLKKAERLRAFLKTEGKVLSLFEAYHCVHHRVIGETWNGIVLREKNVLKQLQSRFTQLQFSRSEAVDDHRFAIDLLVHRDEKLCCAMQIKPKSYLSNKPYLMKAKKANQQKYAAFEERFAVPVFEIYADQSGRIFNTQIFTTLSRMNST